MFDGAADRYDRFMGRYSRLLAASFADFAGVRAGQRVLDVGCGPGALVAELVRRVGPAMVAAVDPSESFAASAQEREPGVDVRVAAAEKLPFADDAFDVVLGQLVVHFLREPVHGLVEMARVTRSGGTVAACVWDHARGGAGPLRLFWEAAREAHPEVEDESERPGTRRGHLAELLAEAGLREVEENDLAVTAGYRDFADWWEALTLGVGPAGSFVASLDEAAQEDLRRRCERRVPAGPFEISARAWCARGRTPRYSSSS